MEQIATHSYFRTRLFLYTLIVVILGAALAGFGVFTLLPSGLGEGYGAALSTIRGIGNVLMQKVVMLYAVIATGILVAMAGLHLFYSHRIAGPAYRLGREAAKISEGNLAGNIRFRQKDNLTDMADSLSAVAVQYRNRIDAIKDHISHIEARAEALSTLLQQGTSDPALEQASDEIIENIKGIDRILAETRT